MEIGIEANDLAINQLTEEIAGLKENGGAGNEAVAANTAFREKLEPKLETETSKNIFNKAAVINGYYISNTTGELVASTTSAVSPLMPIKAGKQYHIFREGAEGVSFTHAYSMARFVAEDGITPIPPEGTANYNGTPEMTVLAPNNAAFLQINVIFSGKSSNLDTLQVEEGDEHTSYEEYFTGGIIVGYDGLPSGVRRAVEAADGLNNPLSGKIVTFNGDSICAVNGGYGLIIAQRNNMTYENVAVSGGTIKAETYQDETAKHWICRTISTMREDADYIILEGGVNDGNSNLGALSDGYTAELDDTTFFGAFESMLKQSIERWPGKKIGYIFAHKCTDSFSSNGSQDTNLYYAAMKCLKKWGIPYLDLNTGCPPLNYVAPLKAAYTKNGDGWHPNDAGYKAYYVPKIEAWMKTL